MTGYTVNTGSNEKFSTGWDRIFSDSSDTNKRVEKKKKTSSSKGKSTRSGKSARPKNST